MKVIKTVGFVGLGNMGLPMAKRVLGGGFEMAMCGHRRQDSVEELKSLGAREVKTPKEVAQASDVTIAMLPDDIATGEVILGQNGVMEGINQGAGII
jgi:2-hydroxy-3-oxopropionate reductase